MVNRIGNTDISCIIFLKSYSDKVLIRSYLKLINVQLILFLKLSSILHVHLKAISRYCALTYCESCYSGDFKKVLEPFILGVLVNPNMVQQLKTAGPIFENVYKWVGKPKQPKSEDIKQMYRPQIYYEVSLLAQTAHLLLLIICWFGTSVSYLSSQTWLI